MPIYEYACPDCGHKFDTLQKFDDPPVTVCPKCAAQNVKKLISATSFVLKGGGWYSDHYGLKKGGEAASGSASTPSSAAPSPAPAATPAAAPASAPAAPAPSSSSTTSST